MSSKPAQADRFSLRRWSQRKLGAARAESQTAAQAPLPPVDGAAGQTPAGTAHNALEPAGSTSVSTSVSTLPASADLPAIDSLTIDSDFAPFFKPQVDESIKRAALKQLFRDPRFNIMDGLDTYIDDYTQPDPIPSAMLEDLMQRRTFFSPPAAETDPGERVIDEPAGDSVASSADAVAPPIAPVARTDAAPDTADTGLESGVVAKDDKP
jgi:Protein of unknown function (DUF3306)